MSSDGPSAPPRLSILSASATLRYLKIVAWAQGRMILHSYTRSPLILLSALLLVACFAPWVGILSVWSLNAFRTWEPDLARELLHIFLFAIWAGWVSLPLYGFSMSETMGTYNLRSFPVPPTLVLLGRCLAALLDIPILFLIPPFFAVLVGFWSESLWAFLLGAASLAILTVNFVCGSLVLSALMRLFPRTKGTLALVLAILVIAIVPSVWFLLRRFFNPQAVVLSREFLVTIGLSHFFSFLPPGFVANASIALERGAIGLSLAFLAALAGSTVLLFLAGSWLSLRADLAVEGSNTPRAEEMPASAPSRLRRLPRIPFSPELWAVMAKEAALFRRDPELRLYLIIIPALIVPLLLTLRIFGEVVPWVQGGAAFALAWVTLIGSSGLLFNLFGYDREGLASLFLSSAPRRLILAGANLVVSLFIFLEVMIVSFFGWFFFEQRAHWLQTALALVILLPILAGIGNFCSILFPYYVLRDRRGLHQAGMARVWIWGLSNLFFIGLAFALALPAVMGATIAPMYHHRPGFLVAIPVALLYSFGLYSLSLRYGSRLLLSREPEILQRCSAPAGERD
jgi:ABC-2 type transport system permease protein